MLGRSRNKQEKVGRSKRLTSAMIYLTTWGFSTGSSSSFVAAGRRRLSLDLNLREDRNSATTWTRWRRIDSLSPLARRRLSRDLQEDRNSATTGTRRGASRRRHKPFRVHGIAEPTGGAIVIGWEQLEFLFYEGEQLDMDAAPNRVEVGHLFLG